MLKKRIILTGEQCRLLCKVINSGWGFHNELNKIIKENVNLPNGEEKEVLVDHYVFNDVICMIKGYLNESLSLHKPDEEEITALSNFVNELLKEK
jgi:hypothetical protein